MPFQTAQQVKLQVCSHYCGASSREAVNTKFTAIGLTQLGIKRKSTAPEADALTTRASEKIEYKSENVNSAEHVTNQYFKLVY